MGDEEILLTMDDETVATDPFDRTINQAIVTLKKGAYLLKCGPRGRPKFCPFRLSTDENFLIWYSGQDEKYLRLSSVTKIIPGQKTVSFQRQLHPERECQSFSLIYGNDHSLDLICKDKAQAFSWFEGLKAVISKSHHPRQLACLRNRRGAQSCVNSPSGYIRRKNNLGLQEDATKISQVRSLCGSPTQSLSQRCFSEGLSCSSNSLYSSASHTENVMDVLITNPPYIELGYLKNREAVCTTTKLQTSKPRFVMPAYGSPLLEKTDTLRDVMIWGGGVEGGYLSGGVQRFGNHNGMQVDALLPKLLESTAMLDIQKLSLGGEHAALVTKQGEVFCWGEEKWGRLGHKVNMNVSCPKIVESLTEVHVRSVTCGEYQTCALTYSGKLYTWGDSGGGVDLVGQEINISKWLPHKISGPLDGISIAKVACGEWHTAVVTNSGQLFTYGDGTFGVLGHGDLRSVSQPKEVEVLKGLWVKSVACGPWHTAAIVEIMADRSKFNAIGGKLFTWGDGDEGKLGHVDGERKLLPTCVAELVEHDFVQVACGTMLTVGLTNLGSVYTMGSAVHGQLGNPHAKDKSITIVEGKLKHKFVKEISSGSCHIAVLTSEGSVYTWGKGANGQLGLGDIHNRNSPHLVEALRDRQVESIDCGKSITAAICLHRSISGNDQSACSGCRVTFGFTRKKHNCYNCGLHFCGSCSSRKVMSASLAPNKSKPFRVCDSCFNHLQTITHSSSLPKLKNRSPRQMLTTQKTSFSEREDRRETTPTWDQLLLPHLPVQTWNEENQCTRRKTLKSQEENQQFSEYASYLSVGLPRWGQVPRPVLFETSCGENSKPLSKSPLASVPLNLQQILPGSKSTSSNSIYAKKDSDEVLIEEIQILKDKVRSLEKQNQLRSEKIQGFEQKIEETWALAREEAAKSKAAKEVLRALTSRLHTVSEKPSSGDSRAESVCSSPIGSSDILNSTYGRDESRHGGSGISEDISKQSETQEVRVEQFEPGVYITVETLPSGQRGLKRVRFSRKRFTDKEAKRWWEENHIAVYQNYKIEGYTCLNEKC